MEVGQPFDYRPLLSFYVCLAAQGLAFVGMGLFFSTLTKNQIVAAVLTFVGMMAFLFCYMIRDRPTSIGMPPFLQTALGRLSFYHMWERVARGPAAATRRAAVLVARGVLAVPVREGAGNPQVELTQAWKWRLAPRVVTAGGRGLGPTARRMASLASGDHPDHSIPH